MSGAVAFSELVQAVEQARPRLALVIGSGLSPLMDRWTDSMSVHFGDVPGLTATTVAGHRGRLTLARWAGGAVLVFDGRLHYYEGHAWRMVLQPIHLARRLGVRTLILTSAAGGIHDSLAPGSLMAVRDHLDWTQPWHWRLPGPGSPAGPRPSPYSPRLLEALQRAAQVADIPLRAGVYAQVTGPCYETPAEIRALGACGADAVGMSIAREIEAAAALGLECAVLSCITNRAAGLTPQRLSHDEVLARGRQLAATSADLLETAFRNIDGF